MKLCFITAFLYLFKSQVVKGEQLYIATIPNADTTTTTLSLVTNNYTSTRVIKDGLEALAIGEFVYYVKATNLRKIFVGRIGETVHQEFAEVQDSIYDVYLDQSNGDLYYTIADRIGVLSRDGKQKIEPVQVGKRRSSVHMYFVRHTSEDTEVYYRFYVTPNQVYKLRLKTKMNEKWIRFEVTEYAAFSDEGLFRWISSQPNIITKLSYDKKYTKIPFASFLNEEDRKGDLNMIVLIGRWLIIQHSDRSVGYDFGTKERTLLLRCSRRRCPYLELSGYFVDRNDSMSLVPGAYIPNLSTDTPYNISETENHGNDTPKDGTDIQNHGADTPIPAADTPNNISDTENSGTDMVNRGNVTPTRASGLKIISSLVCAGLICCLIVILIYFIKPEAVCQGEKNNTEQAEEISESNLYTSNRQRNDMDNHVYTMASTEYLELCNFNEQLSDNMDSKRM